MRLWKAWSGEKGNCPGTFQREDPLHGQLKQGVGAGGLPGGEQYGPERFLAPLVSSGWSQLGDGSSLLPNRSGVPTWRGLFWTLFYKVSLKIGFWNGKDEISGGSAFLYLNTYHFVGRGTALRIYWQLHRSIFFMSSLSFVVFDLPINLLICGNFHEPPEVYLGSNGPAPSRLRVLPCPKEPAAKPAAPNPPSESRQLAVRSLSLLLPCGKNLFLLKQMV